VIVASTLVTALGLGGLARKDMPERTPLILGVGLGTAIVAMGYAGPIGGPVSGLVRDLLDGPLVAFRNLHKFSPVIALPLALGVAHGGAGLAHWFTARWARRHDTPVPKWRRVVGVGVVTVAVVLAAFPLVAARLPTLGSFEEVPDHWQEAASWLADRTDGRRTLVVPAAAFGEYEWGRSFNEPMQPLAEDPWAVRDLIPLGSLGATRLMDGVEELLVTGDRSPALAEYLARAGVRYVVVRNDLDIRRVTPPRPQIVRSVLAGVPGITRVARFGPPVEPLAVTTRLLPSLTTSVLDPPQAVEIYEVEPLAELAVTYPTDGIQVLSGGPEQLLDLGAAGALDGRAVVLAGEADAPLDDDDQWVITDGLRRRDVNFGRVHAAASYALTADQDGPNTDEAPRDRLPLEGDEHLTVARNEGVAEISSSSYAQGVPRFPEAQPFAAFDDDPFTSWRPSSSRPAVGQWIEVRFDEPVDLSEVSVAAPPPRLGRARVSSVRLTTENGETSGRLTSTGGADGLEVAPGETDFLRLTILSARGGTNALEGPGISEITIPGVEIERPLVTPVDRPDALGDGDPLVLLSRGTADPFDLVRADEDPELHRAVTFPEDGSYTVSGTAVPRPGEVLDQRLAGLAGPQPEIEASTTSTYAGLPVFSGRRLLDGDPLTAWVSDPSNPVPAIRLSWDEPRVLSELTIADAGPPTERPTQAVLDSPAGEREVDIPQEGPATFDPLATSELTISFPSDVDPEANPTRAVGITELGLDGLAGLETVDVDPTEGFSVPCGEGPPVEIDGTVVETALRGTVGDLLSGRTLDLQGCGAAVPVAEGEQRIDAETAGQFAVVDLVLTPSDGASAPAAARPLEVQRWDSVERVVDVAPGDEALLAVTENFNPGWRATLDGQTLDPVRVDGWRQAFVVPEGEGGEVTITFGPDRIYRAGLLLGLVFVVALVLIAAVPARRPSPAPAVGERRWPAVIGLAVAVVVCALVAGPLVLLVPLLLLLPDRDDTLPFLAAVSFVLAGILVALETGPGGNAFGPATQILATQALAAVLVSLSPDRRRRAERRGESTARTEAAPDEPTLAPAGSPPPAAD
jgi:arabinofuranan 3-O-arabinosyltransferase